MTDMTNDQIRNKLESYDRWRAQIDAEQQRMRKTLFGNGDPGWDEQLRYIMAWIGKQEETAKRRAAWWDKLQWVVIPIVITGLVTFFYRTLFLLSF